MASRTVTRGPQLAHTASSRLSRVRTGPGPTVRHRGGLSRSQGMPPGGGRRKHIRDGGGSQARGPGPLNPQEPRPTAVDPALSPFLWPLAPASGMVVFPSASVVSHSLWGLYSPIHPPPPSLSPFASSPPPSCSRIPHTLSKHLLHARPCAGAGKTEMNQTQTLPSRKLWLS